MTAAVSPLAGRARELDSLRDALSALQRGRGGVVLLVGEAGIGKTRLAAELAGLALAGGVSVSWGRSPEGEAVPPCWPWRQALRSLGIDATVLDSRSEATEDRYRVLEGLSRALADASTAGLVLIFDDVHGIDDASRRLLLHVSHEAAASRILLVATARPVPGTAWLGDLQRAPAARRWDLGPLVADEVEALLPDPREAPGIVEATGGNPLFVNEAARALVEGTWNPQHPPRSVLDIVAARLGRLPARSREVLEVAAVSGRELDREVLACAVGRDPAEDLDVAAAEGLLDGPGGRFTHALTRDAVVQSLPPTQRRRLHALVGGAVEQVRGGSPDHLAILVQHAVAAGDRSGVRRWAALAGAEAARRLAFEDSAALYRMAVEAAQDDAERRSLLVALGRAATAAGDLDGAATAAAAAADLAETPAQLAEAALLLEPAAAPTFNAVAAALCDRALLTVDDEGIRARLLALRSRLAFYDGDVPATTDLSAQALQLARTSGDDRAMVDALRARQNALPGPRGRAERQLLADEVVAASLRLHSSLDEMWGRLWQVETRIEGGQLNEAQSRMPALEVVVDRLGGPSARWHLDRTAACLAQAQGRYADAALLGDRALARMKPLEPAPARGAWLALQTGLSLHVAASDAALTLARQSFTPLPRFVTMSCLSRALLLLAADDLAAAEAAYLQAGPRAAWQLPVFFVVPGLVVGTRVAAALGRREDLLSLAAELDGLRGEHAVGTAVSYLGPVELALGIARRALDEDAVPDLRTAVAAADASGAPGFAAEARLLLGACLSGAEATRLRTEGERAARALGADRLLARGTDDPLSPRERQVVGLVAEGLTNRQIAERLVLSERTAQNHVQHVLTKLGLTNRAQLTAWWLSR